MTGQVLITDFENLAEKVQTGQVLHITTVHSKLSLPMDRKREVKMQPFPTVCAFIKNNHRQYDSQCFE